MSVIKNATTAILREPPPKPSFEDDLTIQEKISLLSMEFDQLTNECIVDALKSFDNDLETTRTVIQELFPSSGQVVSSVPAASDLKSDHPKDDVELYGEQSSLVSGSESFLEITPDFFAKLHHQFEARHSDYDCLPSITQDFDTQGSILLPLDSSVALAIYKNIFDFVRQSNAPLGVDDHLEEEQGLDPFEDQTALASLRSLTDHTPRPTESADLKEIMELEQVIKASREEYLQQLYAKLRFAEGGEDSAAIMQEICIEKKRVFLVDKFPGVDESKLNNLFEINCFNLNETIKDIEAIFNEKLPNCYRHSLYCDIVKRPKDLDSGNGSSEGSSVCEDEDDDNYDYGDEIRTDKEFASRIQALVQDRKQHHVRIAHLRQKRCNFRRQPYASELYQQEIARCNMAMTQLSDSLVQTYVSYGYPNNSIDLHGLIMREVRSIVPEVLRRKQQQILQQGQKRAKLKLITGIGQTAASNGYGLIRNYVHKFILKNGLKYETDGPGAFVLTLSTTRKLIDF